MQLPPSPWTLVLCGVLALACTRPPSPAKDGDEPDSTAAGAAGQGSAGASAGAAATPSGAGGTGGAGSNAPNAGAAGSVTPPVSGSAGVGSAGIGAAGTSADLDAGPRTDASDSNGDGGLDAATDASDLEPPSETAVYRADRYIGGLDHITIVKQDDARGYCSSLHLIAPRAQGQEQMIEVPEDWSYSGGRGSSPSSACETPMESDVSTQAVSAKGFIRVREPGQSYYPCSLDIDVELTFEPASGIPERDRFLIEALQSPCE